MTSLGLLSEQERSLLIRVARCPLISQAMASATHPCREIVGTQAVPEQERQVPEGWAGNLRAARIAFLSSNPSISMPAQGQPPATAEAYPVASWPDDQIAEFLGRRFDQAIRPHPFVRDSHYLQRDGQYSAKKVRFWLSIRNRAAELLGDAADPGENYVMTEVVHCKSRGETGVASAAATCAARYLDDILSLTAAAVIVVVGKHAHAMLTQRLPHLPQLPYITTGKLGGRSRELVFIWHPAAFQGPKKIEGLHGAEALARLRALAAARGPAASQGPSA